MSVQSNLLKDNQLPDCQPPTAEISMNLMPPEQRKGQMELGEGSSPQDKKQRSGENVMQQEGEETTGLGGAKRRGRGRVKLLQLSSDCQSEKHPSTILPLLQTLCNHETQLDPSQHCCVNFTVISARDPWI